MKTVINGFQGHCDLNLLSSDPKIKRDLLQVITNQLAKYENLMTNRFQDIQQNDKIHKFKVTVTLT